MTKHQTISLKLAQWMGKEDPRLHESGEFVNIGHGWHTAEFNPFSDSTEGRAQFAECLLKAWSEGIHVDKYNDCIRSWANNHVMSDISHVKHGGSQESIAAATLEAIYLAIGGERNWE